MQRILNRNTPANITAELAWKYSLFYPVNLEGSIIRLSWKVGQSPTTPGEPGRFHKIETSFSSTFSKTMDSFTIQSSSGQDYAGHATFQDTSYAFVFDGHGYNDCIHHIKQLDMNLFATLPCPPTSLEASFAGKNFYKSGATFVLARITGTLLEVFHVGDAKAHVYVNDVLVHETIDHTFLLPQEIARTTAIIHHTKAPFPVNDTHAEMLDSPVGHFDDDAFVPSQALGHNGVSGLEPGHFVLEFQPYDSVRVVCGSDCFWVMLPKTNGTAQELCFNSLSRWKQKWHFQGQLTTFDSPDDIAVSLLLHSPSVCIPYSLSSFTSDHVRNAFPFPVHKVY